MTSKNIYFQLIIRILLLVTNCLALSFSFVKQQYMLLGVFVLLLLLQSLLLFRYLNQTNKKIAFFFKSIINEDFTLSFPEKTSTKSLGELNKNLNKINAQIKDVHLQLQAKENYYQEILNKASIGIMTFNEKGHIIYSNPTLQKIFNHTPLNHIKQFNLVYSGLYEVFDEMVPNAEKLFEITNEREKIQLSLKSSSLSLHEESLMLVTVQDIHKELDNKETDSWGKLLRVLIHEIMNTITPITSISESLSKYYNESSLDSLEIKKEQIQNTSKGLHVIHEQSRDLISFVDAYRSLLNLPKPDKKIVNAKVLLEKVKTFLYQQDDHHNVVFEVNVTPKNLEFFLDEKQVSQVLINLFKNAQQSIKNQKDGVIRVSAGLQSNRKKFIEVWNNGPSIPQEIINEIFVPFFTTKEKGTGLGLSLSKQIMQLHGGSLTVFSDTKKGTSFILSF